MRLTLKSPRRVSPVKLTTLLYVLLNQVIFQPLRLLEAVSLSDAVMPNVTATPLRPIPDGVDLPEELSDCSEDSEW